MGRFTKIPVTITLALIWSVQAYAVTIDFSEDVTEYIDPEGVDVFLTKGFEIVGSPDAYPRIENESLVIVNPPYCCAEVNLAAANGAAFSLNSVFLSTLDSPNDWHITGYQAGGGTVMQQVSLGDGVISFDDQWNNLLSVTFAIDPVNSYFSVIDDINVSVVPIPAAVWLFGSAVAGLGWMRRKQTV